MDRRSADCMARPDQTKAFTRRFEISTGTSGGTKKTRCCVLEAKFCARTPLVDIVRISHLCVANRPRTNLVAGRVAMEEASPHNIPARCSLPRRISLWVLRVITTDTEQNTDILTSDRPRPTLLEGFRTVAATIQGHSIVRRGFYCS